MITIGRKLPANRPRGDYVAYCDYCGAPWYRSRLRKDGAGLYVCPDEGAGLDEVTLRRMNAAAAGRPFLKGGPGGDSVKEDFLQAAQILRDTDTTAPAVVSLSPVDGGTSPMLPVLVATFNKRMQRGSGAIELYDSADTLIQTFASEEIEFSNYAVRLTVDTVLTDGTDYYVLIADGALQDWNQVGWEGFDEDTDWNFTAAFVASYDPPDDSTGASTGTGLTITFTEEVEAA